MGIYISLDSYANDFGSPKRRTTIARNHCSQDTSLRCYGPRWSPKTCDLKGDRQLSVVAHISFNENSLILVNCVLSNSSRIACIYAQYLEVFDSGLLA